MALKVSLTDRLAFILIFVSLVLFGPQPCRAAATETEEAVSLEKLTVGVWPRAQMRFRLTNIKVGRVSVLHLFKVKKEREAVWWKGGYFRKVKFYLRINSGAELQALKQILLAHPGRPLEVVFEAERFPFWSRLPWLNSEDQYKKSILIPVHFERTTCDEVTRVVYEKIISTLAEDEGRVPVREEMRGETDASLDVNELFVKLNKDSEIETYIKSLDSVTNNPCATTIRLLKSLREGKATRFDSGAYSLRKDIQDGLKLILSAMASIDPDWSRSNLSVKVTGYTDKVEVRKNPDKKLQISETGIGADVWGGIDNSFEVYYAGCLGNKLVRDRETVRLSFPSGKSEQHVGPQIDNNCELGAVRAYVALVYLTGELGRISPDDSYATGGIYSGSDTDEEIEDDPEKRRVNVRVLIKAAKVTRSNPQ